jgi:cytidylate kinase
MIVAIDGPAGAGKSTIARLVAERLDYQLIDTGAIYRTVAWRALEENLDLDEADDVADLAASLRFDFRREGGGENVLICDGRPMSDEIRAPHVSLASSQISSYPAVRRALLDIQRDLGRRASSVLEGRDIGTVVFPDARVKIFLTASDDIRANRRLEQMKERGEDADLADVLAEIVERDRRDSERDIAPLKQADDAVAVDTSELDVDEVVEKILEIVESKSI